MIEKIASVLFLLYWLKGVERAELAVRVRGEDAIE
jgi:hypothetical protein